MYDWIGQNRTGLDTAPYLSYLIFRQGGYASKGLAYNLLVLYFLSPIYYYSWAYYEYSRRKLIISANSPVASDRANPRMAYVNS